MKAQLEDNEQTIRELSEETETMKTENNELRQEKETLKAEIWSLKQQIEMNEEKERTNRRNNTPEEDNTTTKMEEILLLTDSNGLRVIEHIKNRRSVKHVTTYRMQDAVNYTESKKHLNRPVYIMVGTNDILDGKPAEDIIETLKTATQQFETHNLPYKLIQLPPNRTSTEADHETICYNRMITKVYPNNTIKTAELYKTKDPLTKDKIHRTPGVKIHVAAKNWKAECSEGTRHTTHKTAQTPEERQPPTNHHQTRQREQDKTTTMSIKSEYTGRVIGKGGEKRRIQTKHNTTIMIVDRGQETKITISGTPRNGQLTKQDILDTIEKARNDRGNKLRKQQRINSEMCRNGPNCKFGDKCRYHHDPHPPTMMPDQPAKTEHHQPSTHTSQKRTQI